MAPTEILRRAEAMSLIGPGEDPLEDPAARLARLVRIGALSEKTVEDIARLVPADRSPSPGFPERAEPPSGDDRYQVGALLGQGGMGQVYAAHDRALGRRVALKLLNRDHEDAVRRFLREAQAQARVDHPHVCKVFDAGSLGGRPYIAMQLIDGPSLADAAPGMSLAQRVRLLADVAFAVHAAHKLGLLHRDLKPGNILVERAEHGWHAYVTDFGLALEMAAAGTTVTGHILGTPQYMSPEQARGLRDLDERSDVYSLGATLYALLAGVPPFTGNAAEVLTHVIGSDPPPLRRRQPAVQRDLETVVMKCLEKDPGRRYASARALGDDLERFLDGEPVLAHPPSRAYRLAKLVRRHRALAGAAALVVVGLGIAGAVWRQARTEARERAELGRKFGQEVERVENIMERAYALPLHDVRQEQALVRARLAALRDEMARLGAVAEGPGDYALGRGALALHEYAEARAHLERAWQRGYRTPEVAYALGLTLGLLYQQGIEQLERDPPELRAQRRADLERTVRDPGLAYLLSAREAELDDPRLVSGMIALFERRFDDAAQIGEQVFGARPWVVDAKRLAGDARVGAARARLQRGAVAEALSDLERGGADYRVALDIARSDPSLHLAECQRLALGAEALERLGRDPTPQRDLAVAACDRALAADARLSRARLVQAEVLSDSGEDDFHHGRDPRPALDRALEHAAAAIAIDPTGPELLAGRARIHRIRADADIRSGRDSTPELEKAIADLSFATLLQPGDPGAQLELAAALQILATHQSMQGRDARPALERAAAIALSSTRSHPDNASGLHGLAIVYHARARYESQRGADFKTWAARAIDAEQRAIALNPRVTAFWMTLSYVHALTSEYESDDELALAAADRGIEALRRALEIDPNEASTHSALAMLHLAVGNRRSDRGQDPMAAYTAAIDALQRSLAINPRNYVAFHNLGLSHLGVANYLLDTGKDPTASLDAARASLIESTRIKADSAWVYSAMCDVEIARARWLIDRGNEAAAAFARCDDLVDRAQKLKPNDRFVFANTAKLHRWRAEWLRRRGRSPDAEIAAGLAAARASSAIAPDFAYVLAIEAELWLLALDGEQDAAKRLELARNAVSAADRCVAARSGPLDAPLAARIVSARVLAAQGR